MKDCMLIVNYTHATDEDHSMMVVATPLEDETQGGHKLRVLKVFEGAMADKVAEALTCIEKDEKEEEGCQEE